LHTFSYRSKKDTAFLEARLSYRITGNPNPISFYTRSKIEVTKDFWNDCIKNTKFKDVEKINLKKEIDDHTHDLRKYLLNEFDKTDLSQINKDWFKKVVSEYYNPPLITFSSFELLYKDVTNWRYKTAEHEQNIKKFKRIPKDTPEKLNLLIRKYNYHDYLVDNYKDECVIPIPNSEDGEVRYRYDFTKFYSYSYFNEFLNYEAKLIEQEIAIVNEFILPQK